MAKLAVFGPLNETNLHFNFRTHPVRAHARQTDSFRERRLGYFHVIQARAQIEQEFGIEAGADLSGEDEVVALVMSNQQRTESDAFSLRIRKPTDDEVL